MKPLTLLALLSIALGCSTQHNSTTTLTKTEPAHTPLPHLASPLQDRTHYFLSILEHTHLELLRSDKDLQALQQSKHTALLSINNSKAEVPEIIAALRWSDAEITQAESALRRLARTHPAFRTKVATALRSSGLWIRQSTLSDEDLIAQAWRDSTLATNTILNWYGLGTPPAYPKIDSIAFDPKDKEFTALLRNTTDLLLAKEAATKDNVLFFHTPLWLSLELMMISRRDEAARFEPLELGANRAAIAQIKKTDFSKYPYTHILIPGIGPEDPNLRLSPLGRINAQLGALAYHEHKAPFLIVSGGYVHPNQTKYSEAVEMRRALIEEFNIPPEAILLEPHARHTTTNLRNAARLLYRYNVPFTKPGLIASNRPAADYISSEKLMTRSQKELGYRPAKSTTRKSPTLIEWLPSPDSLQSDPDAPLEP